MKYLLIASILLLAACGRPHGYEVGTCFKGDDAGLFYQKIVDIRDDKYLIRDIYKNPPAELGQFVGLLLLPTAQPIDFVDSRFIVIPCP